MSGIPIIYRHPRLYEWTLKQPYLEIQTEVAFIESLFNLYSGEQVQRVLEIGCGPATHAIALAKRGYRVEGLDLSEEMLRYADLTAEREGVAIKFHKANLQNFDTKTIYDAVLCTHETILHLLSNKDYYEHFQTVAKHLRRQGLYYVVLDAPAQWLSDILKQPQPIREYERSEIAQDDITVTRRLFTSTIDTVTGVYDWGISCTVRRGLNVIEQVESWNKLRVLMTQEFAAIVDASGAMEIIACYGDFDLNSKLTSASPRRIALLQKNEI